MELKTSVRKIDETDFNFVYTSLCDLENEILEFKIIEKILSENISNQNYLYLIAEHGSDKVGFITFHTQNLLHHAGRVGEIQEFYIIPSYRNKGVGRLLIDNVLNFADQNKLESIEVTTNKRRAENVAIYENLGFSLTHHKFTVKK